VSTGKITDSFNYIGADIRARDGEDRFDFRKPPPIHGLSLNILQPKTGENYAADIRAIHSRSGRGNRRIITRSGDLSWILEVRGGSADRRIELRWFNDKGNIPSLLLQDLTNGRVLQMDHIDHYTFLNNMGEVRRFKVTSISRH
jgi:hypothetical protein